MLWFAAVHDLNSAIAMEKAGADMLVFHPDYTPDTNALLESLRPLGSANGRMSSLLTEIIQSLNTKVIAGVCGSDPFLLRGPFFKSLQENGVSGVFNFPTLGLLDGVFRANLEESGIRFDQEIKMLSAARTAGLISAAMVFNSEQSSLCAGFGSEFITLHLGLESHKGSLRAVPARESLEKLREMVTASKANNSSSRVLLHTDALENAESAAEIWREMDDLDGFFVSASPDRFMELRKAVEKSRIL